MNVKQGASPLSDGARAPPRHAHTTMPVAPYVGRGGRAPQRSSAASQASDNDPNSTRRRALGAVTLVGLVACGALVTTATLGALRTPSIDAQSDTANVVADKEANVPTVRPVVTSSLGAAGAVQDGPELVRSRAGSTAREHARAPSSSRPKQDTLPSTLPRAEDVCSAPEYEYPVRPVDTARAGANATADPVSAAVPHALTWECATCHTLCDWSKGCTGGGPSACNRCDFELFGRGPVVEWRMNRIVEDNGVCTKTPADKDHRAPEGMADFWQLAAASIQHALRRGDVQPYPRVPKGVAVTATAPWEQLWQEEPDAPWAGVTGGPLQVGQASEPAAERDTSAVAAPSTVTPPLWAPRPGRECIFFTHTPPLFETRPPAKQRLTVMAACAVESALRFNPDMDVCMLSNALPEAVHQRIALDVSPNDPERFRIVPFDFLNEADGNGDPTWAIPRMRELYESNTWRKGNADAGNSPGMLLSDAIRPLIVWRYGGVYMDMDVWTLRSLKNRELRNTVGVQESTGNHIVINGAVLNFDQGNFYLNYTIHHLVENFYCCHWGWNGPTNVGRSYMNLQSAGRWGSSGVDVTDLATSSVDLPPLVNRRIVGLAPPDYYYPLRPDDEEVAAFLTSERSFGDWIAGMRGRPATLHLWSQKLWGKLDGLTAHSSRLPVSSLVGSIMAHTCPALHSRCTSQPGDGKTCSLKWPFDANFTAIAEAERLDIARFAHHRRSSAEESCLSTRGCVTSGDIQADPAAHRRRDYEGLVVSAWHRDNGRL